MDRDLMLQALLMANINKFYGGVKMEEKILEICKGVDDSIDYTFNTLIDDGVLDSVTLISIVSEMSDVFDVYIPYEEIIPENFNSIKAMAELVEKYV